MLIRIVLGTYCIPTAAFIRLLAFWVTTMMVRKELETGRRVLRKLEQDWPTLLEV